MYRQKKLGILFGTRETCCDFGIYKSLCVMKWANGYESLDFVCEVRMSKWTSMRWRLNEIIQRSNEKKLGRQ